VKPDVQGRYHEGTEPTFRASSRISSPITGLAREALAGGAEVFGTQGADALAFLRGTWRVQRRLADHVTGSIGSFEGVASFTADGVAVLSYHEEGELRFGEYSGPASRDLIYRAGGDGAADVCFADGREFYRLDLRPGTWRDQHLCDPDRYTVAGRLLGPDSFEERWRASGPRKDYEIITTLVRTRLVRAQAGAA
jgi:hypothetical protein